MLDFNRIEDAVEQVLIDMPETRNSDNALFIAMCDRINPAISKCSLKYALEHAKEIGLPNMHTISRCRRKIQALHPELQACDAVMDERYDNWKEAREYAQQ